MFDNAEQKPCAGTRKCKRRRNSLSQMQNLKGMGLVLTRGARLKGSPQCHIEARPQTPMALNMKLQCCRAEGGLGNHKRPQEMSADGDWDTGIPK